MNTNISKLIHLYFLNEAEKFPVIPSNDMKQLLDNFMLYHGCSLCEQKSKYLKQLYPNCPTIYNLHHKDPSTKYREIKLLLNNQNDLLNELKKCIILCKNCHEYIDHNNSVVDNIPVCYNDFILYIKQNILTNGLFNNDPNANPINNDNNNLVNNIINNANNLINRANYLNKIK